ncbi:hypothetical protein PHISCL_11123 [Aspergillus sclerotialis]|uniref:Uncharacterized protein n=1 Tax=Aspergillus sclerotialis TaxID=2070753 RepID=A0A3A2Z1B7_9EURO|nr:hypothetical protein PHISCL_11123 [Aspergillus sclerotialis]
MAGSVLMRKFWAMELAPGSSEFRPAMATAGVQSLFCCQWMEPWGRELFPGPPPSSPLSVTLP